MRCMAPRIMDQKEVTAYALAQRSAGRISQSAAYRIQGGTKRNFSLEEMQALCDVLQTDMEKLFMPEMFEPTKRRGKR